MSGLLSLGLGVLIRRTVGAVAMLIALLIFLSASVGVLPAGWRVEVNPYLPSVAGQAVIGPQVHPARPPAGPVDRFAVFCG